jgi:hypothetical protein
MIDLGVCPLKPSMQLLSFSGADSPAMLTMAHLPHGQASHYPVASRLRAHQVLPFTGGPIPNLRFHSQ